MFGAVRQDSRAAGQNLAEPREWVQEQVQRKKASQSNTSAPVKGRTENFNSRLKMGEAQASWHVGKRTTETFLRVQRKDVTARDGWAATKEANSPKVLGDSEAGDRQRLGSAP